MEGDESTIPNILCPQMDTSIHERHVVIDERASIEMAFGLSRLETRSEKGKDSLCGGLLMLANTKHSM